MQAQHRGSLAHCLSREREGTVLKRQSLQFKMRRHSENPVCVTRKSQLSASYFQFLRGKFMATTIWHNPRCSKSRQTLALLEEQGIDPLVRRYLEDAPSKSELVEVIDQLGITPWELLRRTEAIFKTLELSKNSPDGELIAALQQHPILIERPIVIHNNAAAMGRPPEQVLSLFK